MTDRTWLDHWYGEDPKDTPYYKVVGKRYFEDASKLVTNSPLLDDAREHLARVGKLELTGRPSWILTSERSADLAYKIEAKGVVPDARICGDQARARQRRTYRAGRQSNGIPGGFGEAKSDAAKFGVSSPLILGYETDGSGQPTTDPKHAPKDHGNLPGPTTRIRDQNRAPARAGHGRDRTSAT